MSIVLDHLGELGRALWLTFTLTLLSCAIGMVLALILATCRVSPIRPLRIAASAYISFMVNIPIAVWLLLFFFGFSKIGFLYSEYKSSVIVLSSWVAAFLAEAIRSGINSVSNGQAEAARALGLSFRQVAGSVVLPQALRSAILPIGVVVNASFRNAAVVSFIGVKDVINTTSRLGDELAAGTAFTLAAFACFFLLSAVNALVFGALDRKFAVRR
jgi:glutamate transport system permease protein